VKTILRTNISILITYSILLIAALMFIFINSKADTHLFFNAHHNSFFDSFFYFTTFLGDGIAAILVIIILLAVKYRFAIIVALSTVVSALIAQALKHLVFADVVRPKKFFEGMHDLYFVPGVDNWLYNSFPSGHSTCAFSMYIALALIVKQKRWKWLLFILAIVTGYSRVYISQHFLEDITAGSVIGTVTAVVMYYWVNAKDKKWLNQSIIDSLRKSQ